MLDFVKVSTRVSRNGVVDIYPKFVVRPGTKDLMIRGRDFYAVWNEDTKMWSTNEYDVIRQIDTYLSDYAEKYGDEMAVLHPLYMWDADSGSIDRWHKYCQKQMRDNFHALDEKIIFANTETTKEDYASKRLSYSLYEGDISAYKELMEVLYDEKERQKIEWSIGAIFTGASKHIQKFLVFYGEAGSGKSTVLNIIQALFDGYYSVFDSRELGSSNNSFALESFKNNPLVSIQHDGDLSRLEDNTKLNSIVSHETMEVNEKFKSKYTARFNTFIYMGTNRPVRITEAKSGLLRRLIDVSPSGRKIPKHRYDELVAEINFELGAIANHCIEVFRSLGPSYYDKYVPISMMSATNDFYDFVETNYDDFKAAGYVTLTEAWRRYREYCEFANVPHKQSYRSVRTELKNYFREFKTQTVIDGKHIRNVYLDFITSKFFFEPLSDEAVDILSIDDPVDGWLHFDSYRSALNEIGQKFPAQYATQDEIPMYKWANVKTTLIDIDTRELHYVKLPENHIVVDFDLKNEKGEKDYEKNLEAASKWPPTYAELSKSGAGIHLHYIYNGDVSKLSHIYDDNIEIKTFTGNSSLRRKLTSCNDLSIRSIGSGLPLKGAKLINWDGLKNEKRLRRMIVNNLNKKYHAYTKPSVCYIYDLLEKAYEEGFPYDVRDMAEDITLFAAESHNQAPACLEMVTRMKLVSAEKESQPLGHYADDRLVFFDCEVFPNLLLINWKYEGSSTVVRMINPTPAEVEELCKMKLVGFNNLEYDNYILWARMGGATNLQIFDLSQRIIVHRDKNAKNKEAKKLSYTDVLDFLSSKNKMSLKKWQIKLGIHHLELGIPWDQPVPESRWVEVSEYCDNDVISTEAVFNACRGDYDARCALVTLANIFAPNSYSTPNDTTNTLTARIIFGDDQNPQKEFVYTDLSKEFLGYIPCHLSPDGKSHYKGELPGEGGYVYAEPGMYTNVVVFDVRSMHPNDAIQLNIFGPRYTKRFADLVELRACIKHKDISKAKEIFNAPELDRYLDDPSTYGAVSDALKTAINSVYGQTKAKYKNKFVDERNKDNIIAKRGALFMIDLKLEVQKRGYSVVHIKTDSIKIPNPDRDILQFVYDFGQKYGLTFEIEEEYEKFCLVNRAVYIAKQVEPHWGITPGGKVYWKEDREDKPGFWTPTGAQFAQPYVFKTLFSKEPIAFEDKCVTVAVTSRDALYLDFNENLKDVSEIEEAKKLFASNKNKYTKREQALMDKYLTYSIEDLERMISEGHSYKFVGKVGQFCPMNPGSNAGLLMAIDKTGQYSAPGGTKGYRFMESEYVREHGLENYISNEYFKDLADAAIDSINKFGDFEWFSSNESIGYVEKALNLSDYMNRPITIDEGDEVPFVV